ncbi:MAG: TolC family protein [Bacteroidota bacterium]
MIKKIAFVAGFLLTISLLNAQEPWTLERCIDYALENNIQIQRQELSTRIYNNEYKQSRYDLLPNLNAQWSHQLSSGRSLNTEDYVWENRELQQGSMGIGSNVTLFNGMQNYNNIQERKFSMMADLALLESVKYDVTLNVATNYLQVLFEKELVEINQNQLELTNQQVEKTEKLVEVGNKARGDLLDIKAQQASEKVTLINAQNNLTISILTLTQLLELDSVGTFDIVVPEDLEVDFSSTLMSVDDAYRIAVENHPSIITNEYLLRSSEKKLAMARGERSPELSLEGVYYSRYNETATDPFDPTSEYAYIDQLDDNQYKQVLLRLSIPVFNRMRVNTNISNSKINVQDSKLALENAKNNLYKLVQQSHTDALGALEKYYSSIEAVKSNEEAFKYTEEKYNAGIVSALDYNEAKMNLTKARSDLLQAKYEYIFKTKILDFYMGNPISLAAN